MKIIPGSKDRKLLSTAFATASNQIVAQAFALSAAPAPQAPRR